MYEDIVRLILQGERHYGLIEDLAERERVREEVDDEENLG